MTGGPAAMLDPTLTIIMQSLKVSRHEGFQNSGIGGVAADDPVLAETEHIAEPRDGFCGALIAGSGGA